MTRRNAEHRQRKTRHAPWQPLDGLLAGLGEDPPDRVFLVPGADPIPAAAAMAACVVPDGWQAGRHHLDDRTPVWRFTRPDGQPFEVLSAATWWAGESATPLESAQAWDALEDTIRARFRGARLLSTPGATGLDLLRRSLPRGEAYPVLTVDDQELVRSFAGQARIEPARDGWEELAARFPNGLPRVEVWDARLAYAGVILAGAGLAQGPPIHDVGVDEWPAHGEGFARCTVTVPDAWGHVGLVGQRCADGWRYPSTPGERWEAWLHGSELHLCQAWGWPVEVHERLLFPTTGQPLRSFAKRMVAARDGIRTAGRAGRVGQLVRTGLRAILLHSIGRLHGRPPRIVEHVPADQLDQLAGDVEVAGVDAAGTVEVRRRAATAHDAAASHPEWSAAVWARARVRLLDAPGAIRPGEDEAERTGALHLPPASIVALRTDAIWTTVRPGWADDGRAGRYTLRCAVEGWPANPIPTPRHLGDLLALAADQ